jgi:putative heme-binding domain-containing protein
MPPSQSFLEDASAHAVYLALAMNLRILPLLCCACLTVLPASAQDDDPLPALVQVLGTSDDAQFHLDILKGMSDGLTGRRRVTMPAGWEEIAAKLAKSPNAQVRELVQSLSVTFGSASALAALKQALADSKSDPKARQAALDVLLAAREPGLAESLQALLKDSGIRGGALRGLAAYEDEKTPSAILEVYPSLSAAEKKDALNTLVSRAAFAKPLLAAVGAKTVPAKDLTADLVRQLRQFKDADLNALVTRLWGAVRDSDADKLADMARIKKLVASRPPGEAPKGRVVFSRVCQQCHTLFEVGGKVGPDITGSNRGDLDYILQNIVDPNAVIPNEYQTWNLDTKDDRAITGIVKEQNDNAVTIVTANETLVIPRAEVASLQRGQLSMMPEGLLQALSEEDICDLFAYLKQPAQVPLPGTTK